MSTSSCLSKTNTDCRRLGFTRSQAWAPNLEQPQANKAVIIRIHAQIQFTPDLILAFRALMVETQQYGYHTLFLTTVGPISCIIVYIVLLQYTMFIMPTAKCRKRTLGC